ncbi:response regulator [Chitinimonas sp. PSY-7]|uniref:response regulator n=1 Tax=Chitinimonas sp. PSY-7 TaxID=3459088 RepID=UPI0040400BBB
MTQTDIASDRPRILVVDDSRIVRATVKKHLTASFDVIEEPDGEAGWERLSDDTEVMVLMSDLSMPRLDGFGLLTRVRQSTDPRIRNTPVIIISGEEDSETKNLAVERGANDFVTKSTDRAEMLARVAAAVKLAKTARELRATEVNQARTATTEVQTGLATPHLFQMHGEKLLAHALRVHGEATLLAFEVDDYSSLCTRVGGTVAEQVVSLVAKTVSGRLRKEEILARLDGPRFGIFLYADLLGSLRYAERLREIIAAARINFKGTPISVTVSAGVGSAKADDVTEFDKLLDCALRRLTTAMDLGGNQLNAPIPGKQALPPIEINEALALLADGRQEDVVPHLPALMAKLAPLMALAGYSKQ